MKTVVAPHRSVTFGPFLSRHWWPGASLMSGVLLVSAFIEVPRSIVLGPLNGLSAFTIFLFVSSTFLFIAKPTLPPAARKRLAALLPFIGWVVVVSVVHPPSFKGAQSLVALGVFVSCLVLAAREEFLNPGIGETLLARLDLATRLSIGFYLLGTAATAAGLGGIRIGTRTFALFALLGLCLYLAQWREGSRRGLVMAVIVLAVIMVSQSRLATAIGLLLCVLAQWRLRKPESWLKTALISAVIAAAATYAIFNVEVVRDRVFSERRAASEINIGEFSITSNGRVRNWNLMWNSYLTSPIIGRGAGSAVDLVTERTAFTTHPVEATLGDLLRILHDFGLVGFSLWLFGWTRLILLSYRALRPPGPGLLIHRTAVLALIAVFLGATTDNATLYVFLMGPLGVIVGLAAAWKTDGDAPSALTESISRTPETSKADHPPIPSHNGALQGTTLRPRV